MFGAFGIVIKGLLKKLEHLLGSWWTGEDRLDYRIVENGQNTEKSPGYLRILIVTQTPMKDNQLTLM